jgi:hypothetical protein
MKKNQIKNKILSKYNCVNNKKSNFVVGAKL